MFIQVIHGKTSHGDELQSLAETWRDESGVDAVGYLGGTYGVTGDGDFLQINYLGLKGNVTAVWRFCETRSQKIAA